MLSLIPNPELEALVDRGVCGTFAENLIRRHQQMQIGKKVALMAAAAAGTMVVGGAGSASAHGLFPQDSGARQSNACETNIGPFTTVANLAPPGEVNPNPDCVNVTNSAAVSQSNDCDTTTGAITHGLVDL